MSGALQAVFQNQRSFAPSGGQQAFICAGTFSWVAPTGVTSVSVVAVGAGSRAGGGLGYKNNISVTAGNSYSVSIGSGTQSATAGSSYFINACTVAGLGGGTSGGSFVGDGGGTGGGRLGGGGGAGGYSSNGGAGGCGVSCPAANGNGGGAGGGGGYFSSNGGGGGGGTGLLGTGSNGAGGAVTLGGGGGSGGATGQNGYNCAGCRFGGNGGLYGGGAGQGASTSKNGYGGNGAVRIIWPGNTRSFPSTCTGDF